jgi:hypothetical protein
MNTVLESRVRTLEKVKHVLAVQTNPFVPAVRLRKKILHLMKSLRSSIKLNMSFLCYLVREE